MMLEQRFIDIKIDPATRWSLQQMTRLPGQIEGPHPTYAPGSTILPLTPIYGPKGNKPRTLTSPEGGGLAHGALVEFTVSETKKGGLQAIGLKTISSAHRDELIKRYEERLYEEIAYRTQDQLKQLEAQISKVETDVNQEVSRRVARLTNDLKTLLSGIHDARLEQKSGTVASDLQKQLALWERTIENSLERLSVVSTRGPYPATPITKLPSDLDLPENWLDGLSHNLQAQGFWISKDTLYELLAAILCSVLFGDIAILAGPPGVGKTSSIAVVAKLLGIGLRTVPVRPAWTDPTDLLGFYNPLRRVYQPTPFVDYLIEAGQYCDANRPYVLCLDELNLARIENYASDLLSRLEKSKSVLVNTGLRNETPNATIELYSSSISELLEAEWTELNRIEDNLNPEQKSRLFEIGEMMRRYPAELELSPSIALLGTINVDHTTHQLSPKVLDRSFVVSFPPANLSSTKSERQLPPALSVTPMAFSWLQRLAHIELAENILSEHQSRWQIICEWQDRFLTPLGVHGSYRLAQSFFRFMRLTHTALGLGPSTAATAFVKMKVLPKVSFVKDHRVGQGRTKLEVFQEWYEDASRSKYVSLETELRELELRSGDLPVIQYF